MKEEYWEQFMTTGRIADIFLTKQKVAAARVAVWKNRRNRQELDQVNQIVLTGWCFQRHRLESMTDGL